MKRVLTAPTVLDRLSHDFYWYSPILRPILAGKTGDVAVQPVSVDEVLAILRYAGKHEIFIDLIQQAVEEVVLLAENVAASGQSATERLRDVFVKTLDAYERHYPYMYVYIQEDMRKVPGDGTSVGKELQDLGHRYEAAVQRVIDDGVQSGEFRASVDTQMMKFAIIGALNWTHRWHVLGGRLSGAEIGTAFTDLFLNGALTGELGARDRALAL